jgi:hypothetical protein
MTSILNGFFPFVPSCEGIWPRFDPRTVHLECLVAWCAEPVGDISIWIFWQYVPVEFTLPHNIYLSRHLLFVPAVPLFVTCECHRLVPMLQCHMACMCIRDSSNRKIRTLSCRGSNVHTETWQLWQSILSPLSVVQNLAIVRLFSVN